MNSPAGTKTLWPSAAELGSPIEVQAKESSAAESAYDIEVGMLELAGLKEKLLAQEQDRQQRKSIGQRLIGIVQAWLIGVFLLLLWQGFGSKIGFFGLPESVLNTLLVTTTVNLVGLLYVIARYLYNDKWIPHGKLLQKPDPKPAE